MPFVLEPSWIGRRVSVRRVVGRRPDGQVHFGDVVGDLLVLDPDRAVVDGRDGPVDVVLADVGAARLAPPSTADELALEAIVANGWRAPDTAELGGWRLRAADGFTGRANSVLPLGPPGLPLDDALDHARGWYAERGLPLRLQVPIEARRLLDAGLGERGWTPTPPVHVMAARIDTLRVSADPGLVQIDDRAEDGWLARYRDGAGLEPAARRVLTNHEVVGFAAVRAAGTTIAIGRGTVDDGWLGVTAVEVDPAHRRRGLASAVLAALLAWGRAHGARRTHLEVTSENSAALALYERAGYWTHHEYHYRLDPS
jgi:ribosomal protein S18 acetylase RimI-like enzyme